MLTTILFGLAAAAAEVLGEELAGADRDADRGSHELLRQTQFLTRAFEHYEQRVESAAASGAGMDEHQLRRRMLQAPAPCPACRPGARAAWPPWLRPPPR